MDPLSIAGAVIQFFSFDINGVGFLTGATYAYKWKLRLKSNMDDYGTLNGLLLSTIHMDASRVMRRVKTHLINNSIQEAMVLKTSFTESFTMIGVAGAIIAQIAITALSLGSLNETHWTVYASFITSLISGCLSVYYSCAMQLILSGLHGPQEMYDWITQPKLSVAKDTGVEGAQPNKPKWNNRRIPSFNAAQMLVAPAQLLVMSLAAFLVGLGIYLGIAFSKDLSEVQGTNSALAILIIYILVTSLSLSMFFSPAGYKMLEDDFTLDQKDPPPQGRQEGMLNTTNTHAPRVDSINRNSTGVAVNSVSTGGAGGSPNEKLANALSAAIRAQEEQIEAQRALLEVLKSSISAD